MMLPLPNRPTQLALLLAAATGGPYLYYNGPAGIGSNNGTQQAVPSGYLTSAISAATDPANAYAGGGNAYGLPNYSPGNQVAVTNPAIRDLRQFARFDITPGWVSSTFPRVTTVLSNVQMDGLRVPVVTGTTPSDFAGTVDYYFDRQHSLRRIVLQGYCGEPSGMTNLLMQSYGLQPEPSLGGHLYTARWNNRVTSLAAIQPAPIVYASDAYRKYTVFIELNQPSLEYGLSEQSQAIINNAWQVLRWQQ